MTDPTQLDTATDAVGADPVGTDSTMHLARANLYRWLAVTTLSPEDPRAALLRDEDFRAVVAAALEWMRDDPAFHPDELGPGELSPAELDPELLAPEGEAPGESYWRVFGHSISKTCPPYELEYCPNTDINFRSQRLADAAGFYRAFGLERAEMAKERLDHLSFQAEFMQIVIARELYAWELHARELRARERSMPGSLREFHMPESLRELHARQLRPGELDAGEQSPSGRPDDEAGPGPEAREKAELCRRAQRQFFVEHLGWWLAAFGARLAERRDSPFYRGLGRVLQGFVAAERAVLEVPPFTELPDVHPDSYEAEGGCFDCGLQAGTAGAGSPGKGPMPSCGS